jgi:hypothetical protein
VFLKSEIQLSPVLTSRLLILLILLLGQASVLKGENGFIPPPSDSLVSKRLVFVVAGETCLGAGSLAGLYGLWYADYPQSGFHFINDNSEWRGMDKAGHTMTCYYLGKIGYESLRWAGMKEKKAIWYGGMLGMAYLGTVEIFDGFSAEWGASPGDLAANSLGTALFIGQQLAWKEQRILLKWSFHSTDYAQYNKAQLGSTFSERMLKDYNGQTYWLSANLYSLAGMQGRFPKWLNLAIGYGAEGMTGARSNPLKVDNLPIPTFTRYSQFYLAPDIDLTRIPTRSKNLKLLLNAIGFIKFPLPALEMNKNGLKFHYLYF